MSDNMFEIKLDNSDDGGIDRLIRLLSGLEKDAYKAIGSAIKRAAISGRASAARSVAGYYYITASNFKERAKSRDHITTDSSGTTVKIEFRGYHIPLIKFDTSIGRDGRVMTRVERSSARKALDHAFVQTMKAYNNFGVFERAGKEKGPVIEHYGPSVPQMMNSSEEIREEMNTKIRETFEKRLEHEVLAIMNGWRRDGKAR